jgi:hypothetical protein
MLTLDERGGERNRGSRYARRAVTRGPGRPECPQAGRPESVAGVKTMLSLAQGAKHACVLGRKGGIQTRGRGWALFIWEMSVKDNEEGDCSDSLDAVAGRSSIPHPRGIVT